MNVNLGQWHIRLRKECIDMVTGTETLALTIAPETLQRLLNSQQLSGSELSCLDKRSKEKLKALLLESAGKNIQQSLYAQKNKKKPDAS